MRGLLFAGAVALAAITAGVTPDGAQHLGAAVHDWLSGMLGPIAPDVPVQAEVQGDHYRLTAPLIGVRTPGAPPELSADVRQQPGGTWRIDRASLPARFAIPAAEGETHISIGSQAISGIIDPLLQTASTLHAEAADIRTMGTPAGEKTEQRIGRATLDASLTPDRDGTLDFTERSHFENWQWGAIAANGIAVGTGFRSSQAQVTLKAVAPDHVAPAIHAVFDLIVGASRAPAPDQHAALRKLVEALDGLAGSVRLNESLQGLQIELAGIGHAAIDRARFGFGEEATGGLLRAWVDLVVDGLTIADLPAGLAALVPKRISLRPSVKGVPAKALKDLLIAEIEDSDPASRKAYAETLFAQGGMVIGIDAFAFAVGPAEFAGAGVISFPSATTREGEARVTVTGFDELIQQTTENPSLSQVAPVLAVARGFAKQEGDHLVWAIHAGRDGNVTVNGMELSPFAYPHPAK